MNKRKILISKNYAEKIQSVLNRGVPDSSDQDHCFTVEFENKYQADIKFVNNNGPYVDAVLFDENGYELCVINPVSYSLVGEYEFEHNNEVYRVEVTAVSSDANNL
jgi:hypothetical protein